MTRTFITRKKFYDIRREWKHTRVSRRDFCELFEIAKSTLTKILQARNFKEYKEMGGVYGKGVKVLRKRYLFILIVMVVVLIIINQLIK
jgi:hypothetical protein